MVLGIICFAAAAFMWYVGSNSGNLTELKDFFWVPLPLGLLFLILAGRKKESA